ncbi:MAG: class I SAM-dependent methyltransferase [Betaproteobacteria bacterium]|jgi:caffeoyl-CoA O-methyltransferase|nr:MAG: class I SAM-dependent methyltransferase [Betaproteobacteria bacterium]
MSSKTLGLSDELSAYLRQVSLRDSDLLARLREETRGMPMAGMQVSAEQGQFMQWLVRALDIRRAIEIGVYTGYSSLCVALAMPNNGRIIACDISKEWTSIARRYWQEAGVAHKIELRLAPAVETLDIMLANEPNNSFDFAFIDADKTSYKEYYERALALIRSGGLIAIDNTLWNGAVIDESNQTDDTRAIREFNTLIHADERVDISLLPIGDGLTLALKR